MELDLCTITWEAIGSIMTGLGLIFAFWSIIESNKQNKKNRDLDKKFKQQENEQKRLDQFVNNLLDIEYSMPSIDILNLSMLFVNDMFTLEHKRKLENDALLDRYLYNKLNVQLVKFDDDKNTKQVFDSFSKFRENYGLWARNILLFQNINDNKLKEPEKEIDDIISKMITELRNIDSKIEPYIQETLHSSNTRIGVAKAVLQLYGSILSSKMAVDKLAFEHALFDFVKNEQNRINAIIEN